MRNERQSPILLEEQAVSREQYCKQKRPETETMHRVNGDPHNADVSLFGKVDSLGILRPGEWIKDAECRGSGYTSLFYSPDSDNHKEDRNEREARVTRAKAICGSCAVSTECLTYAISIGEKDGVWGGKDELERKNLRIVSK